jgi:hypothetical protein
MRPIFTTLILGICLLTQSLSAAAAAPPISAAAAIAAQLSPSLVTLTDYNAATDPDQLLGLPGQYIARAAFTDLNHVAGVVEVFPTPEDFANRVFTLKALQVYESEEVDLPPDATDPGARVLLRLWIPRTAQRDNTLSAYSAAFNSALVHGGLTRPNRSAP